jgi:hypothetical protein
MKRIRQLRVSGSGIFFAAMLTLALVTFGQNTHASVITQVTTVDNLGSGNATYGYNWPMLGVGFHSTGGCAASAPFTCTVSYIGTIDPSGLLTSVSQSLIMGASVPADPSIGAPAASASASSYATASLPSGSVGVAAAGDYLDYRFPSSGQAGGSGVSFAQAGDTLHFDIAGASVSTVTDITVTYRTSGSMTVPTPAGDSQGSLRSIFSFGGAGEETDVSSNVNTSYMPVLQPGANFGWVSESLTGNPGLFTFTGVYAITGSHADLGIAETLSDQCGLGTSCDYSHTGTVSFTLPGSVTYTSDAGFLPQQQPSSGVPEPGSMALMAVGLTGLTLIGRNGTRDNGSKLD